MLFYRIAGTGAFRSDRGDVQADLELHCPLEAFDFGRIRENEPHRDQSNVSLNNVMREKFWVWYQNHNYKHLHNFIKNNKNHRLLLN